MKNTLLTLLPTVSCAFLIALGLILPTPFNHFTFIAAIFLGGFNQTKAGLKDVFQNKHLNVELLMILSAVGACLIGNYQEGAILIFIFSLSGSLEKLTLDHSQREIRSLMKLQPQHALRQLNDGSREEVSVKDLKIGDRIIVSSGTAIPVDGLIVEGLSSFEEAAITGESLPVEKTIGQHVYGGTLNIAQPIIVEVTHNSDDILIQKIVRMVEEAESHPSKVSQRIDQIENRYVMVILIIILLAILFPILFFKESFYDAFYRGMILLVVASPCALIASTSPATLSAISNGAKKGLLVKGGKYFETLADTDCVVFDKTGTLTEGKMKVSDVYFSQESDNLHNIIYSIEQHSSHPLANAIVEYYKQMNATTLELSQLEEKAGWGISAMVNSDYYSLGRLFDQDADRTVLERSMQFSNEGKSLVYVHHNHKLIGVIALLDTIRDDAKALIGWLNKEKITSVMMTGDIEATAHQIARKTQVSEYISECLPETKSQHILQLKQKHKSVMMVGDGINDAPALANADIGIAMSSGSDIAMETADIVLVKDRLENIRYGIKLSKRLHRIITQNIIFSVSVMIALVVLTLMNDMTLPFGVIGHEGSTILVILNSLRLLKPLKLD